MKDLKAHNITFPGQYQSSLVEGLHDGKLHDPSEIGLAREHKDKRVVGVHLEIGKEPEFFQGAGLQKMGLIDDEQDGFSQLLFGFQQFWVWV